MTHRIRTTDQARQIRRGIKRARRGDRAPKVWPVHPRHAPFFARRSLTDLEYHAFSVTRDRIKRSSTTPAWMLHRLGQPTLAEMLIRYQAAVGDYYAHTVVVPDQHRPNTESTMHNV